MAESDEMLRNLVRAGEERVPVTTVAGTNNTRVVVHKNFELKEIDPERGALRPSRRRASIHVDDYQSFVDYVRKHKIDDETLVLIQSDGPNPNVKAVLDHHGPIDDQAGWREHSVTYTPKQAPEFLEWASKDRQKFDQEAFAQWVEEHIADIAEPTGAMLREMVLAFQIHKDVAFESSRVLENGQVRLHYSENVRGSVGSGEIDIPKAITLGIPIFLNDTERVRVVARFRYRLERNVLSIWYELDRPDRIRELAFRERLEHLAQDVDPVLVIYGRNQ